MQIKVKEVKSHDLIIYQMDFYGQRISKEIINHKVLVAEGELVFVEEITKVPYQWNIGRNNLGGLFICAVDPIKNSLSIAHKVSPIIISKTEKIEVGDKFLVHIKTNVNHESHNKIFTCKEIGDTGIWSVELDKESIFFNQNIFKIISLPEHFSPQQFQDIVEGKLKEGKVLVECEEISYTPEDYIKYGERFGNKIYQIKLNPHITLHKVEEKLVPVSLLEQAFNAGRERIKHPDYDYIYDTYRDWFEQNVK